MTMNRRERRSLFTLENNEKRPREIFLTRATKRFFRAFTDLVKFRKMDSTLMDEV